jgi:hypothetical protein
VHDPLAERAALARRAPTGVGAVGAKARLVGQERLPADVAGVVVVDHDGHSERGSSLSFVRIAPSGETTRRERKRPNTYAPA